MRTTEPVNLHTTDVVGRKNCQGPRPMKIPFREMLPMQLKDQVSGKKDKSSDVACLPEMMRLFECLNKTEFDTLKCPNETKVFQKCYNEHLIANRERKSKGSLGILVPGQALSDMTSHQINTLLKKYPIAQFMKKIRW